MKKQLWGFLFLYFLTFSFQSSAQTEIDFDDYKVLKSSGSLPSDVTITGTAKYKKFIEAIDKSKASNKDKKLQKQLQLYVNFSVDRILKSGMVLYNDPMGHYVNKVAKTVLKGDEKLYNEMRFYVVRYPYVNAFATSTGIVFITTGLLAQIENEAQLALILCHEIQHFVKNHAYKEFKFGKNDIDKNISKKSDTKDFERLIKKTAFSRELETEADEEGLELYKESGYSLDIIESTFDILQFAHLPFDEKKFTSKYISTKNIQFPTSFIANDSALTPLDFNSDEYDDELSTHPDIRSRRKNLMGLAAKMKVTSDALYLVGKPEFLQCQKIARYELVHINLVEKNFENAFVQLNILLDENPKSHYLQQRLNQCLYGMAKTQVHYGMSLYYSYYHRSFKTVEGTGGGGYYFLGKLIKSDIGLFATALDKMWEYHLANPSDKKVNYLIEDLTKGFIAKYNMDIDQFKNIDAAKNFGGKAKKDKKVKSDKKKDKEEEQLDEEEDTKSKKGDTDKKTKVKKKKKKKKSKTSMQEQFSEEDIRKESRPIFFSAMKVMANNEEYATLYKKLFKENKAITKKKASDDEEETKVSSEYISTDFKSFDVYEFDESVSIEKMVMLAPVYIQCNYNKKESMRFVSSEQKSIDLSKSMDFVSKKIDLPIDDINIKILKDDEVEKLNEMYLVNNYFEERSVDPDFYLVPTDKMEIDNFIAVHNTPFVFKLGVIGLKQQIEWKDMAIAVACCVVAVTAAVIFDATVTQNGNMWELLFKNHNFTYIYADVVDLRTGKDVYSRAKKFNKKDRSMTLKMHLYEVLYQIKTKK